MNGQRIGYQRVSTLIQNTARQLDGIPLDKIFTDKASGKDTNRPELKSMLEFVREGDTVYVHSMDRLARNLGDLRKIVQDLTRKGIKITFVKESLTFTGDDSPMANLLLNIIGSVAEFEKMLIKERVMEGIAIARTKGVYKGRKKSLNPTQVGILKYRVATGEKKSVVARDLGISRETLYKYMKQAQ